MNPEQDDDRVPEGFIPTAQDREGDEMWEGMVKMDTPNRLVLFFRIEGFYPLEIPEGTIADNAKCNPGTIRVEDALTGEVLWTP